MLQIVYGLWTSSGPKQPKKYYPRQTTTNLGCTDLSCSAASWSASRNVMICWYGPIFASWCSYPRRLMEAHNEIFPPRCPGTCINALWPFCSWLFGVQLVSKCFQVCISIFNFRMFFIFWIDVFSHGEISFLNEVSYVWNSVECAGASVLYKGASVL